jgi:hypothetical protein
MYTAGGGLNSPMRAMYRVEEESRGFCPGSDKLGADGQWPAGQEGADKCERALRLEQRHLVPRSPHRRKREAVVHLRPPTNLFTTKTRENYH